MKKSIAQQHRERVLAAKAEPITNAPSMGLEKVLMQWHEDKQRLKSIMSQTEKETLKAQLMPNYSGYIEGLLAKPANASAPEGHEALMLFDLLVWSLDAGFIKSALPLAEYAINKGVPAPDNFARKLPALVIETIADKVLNIVSQPPFGLSEDIVETLQAYEDLVKDEDMHDQIKGKLFKSIAYCIKHLPSFLDPSVEQIQTTLDYLRQALNLWDKAGVKKDIEQMERLLKKTQEQKPEQTPEA